MYTATLLTDPNAPTLDPTLVESLRNAWGGGDAQWLSPDEAAEFDVAVAPSNLWDVWADLQAMGVDLCLQTTRDRRRKVLIADMDSTMIGQECIDELAEAAGVGEKVRAVTARAMNGELDFNEALIARLSLLKGMPVSIVDRVLSNQITLAPGGPVAVATMKANGVYCALVSGGFTAFTGPVAAALGFDEHRSNVRGGDGETLSGQVDGPILGRAAKVEALEDFCQRFGLAEADIMAVGDGANDLGMLGRAGAGVALHAKPAVAAECTLRINHGDLTALLYLQGYSKADFVDPACPDSSLGGPSSG